MQTSGRSVNLAEAISLLARGDIVALPTETVYGLAADATNPAAIVKIYDLKGRPRFNPLICHVSSLELATKLGVLDSLARKLAEAFWPGALTLVVPKAAGCAVDPLASAGLKSLGFRIPDHPHMQNVLSHFPKGLVAPSANASNRLSPVLPEHVWESLGADTPVLDGGRCSAGLESTILTCFPNANVQILRDGAISRERIAEVLGYMPETSATNSAAPNSPGQLQKHYAPRARLRLNATVAEHGETLLGIGSDSSEVWNLSPSGNLNEAAANLFHTLHAMDAAGIEKIAVSPIPNEGLGLAINDRLGRAVSR